jgi:hypothetical protein
VFCFCGDVRVVDGIFIACTLAASVLELYKKHTHTTRNQDTFHETNISEKKNNEEEHYNTEYIILTGTDLVF